MKRLWVSLIFTFLFTAAEAEPLPRLPMPPELSPTQYSWVQTGIAYHGVQPDGLLLYGFQFTFTNTGTTPLVNVYDIMPADPIVNFGITDGVWDKTLKAWTANTAAGFVIAKPYNMVGFLDPSVPQYPVFEVTPYLAPGDAANLEMQFEFSPQIGYFEFGGYLTAVPEPASLALLFCGMVSLGWFARRRM